VIAEKEPGGDVTRYLYPNDEGGVDLLTACVALHMSGSGVTDLLSDEDEAGMLAWLRERLDRWTPTPCEKWRRFDDAVKALVEAAVDEAVVSMEERTRGER